MRILVLPLALAFAACLYLPCPQAAWWIADAIRRLYLRFLSPFIAAAGQTATRDALIHAVKSKRYTYARLSRLLSLIHI